MAPLPCLCYKEEKEEEKRGGKGENSEFSRRLMIIYAIGQ
jgi:hypothetical protein